MYFPQMISAGMVYKATPPLFSVKVAGKDKFLIDNIDMIKYNQKAFTQKYQLKNSKKEVLSTKDLTNFFIRNADYIYHLESLSDTYGIEIPLLEDILTCYVECKKSVNFIKLQKLIKSKYRFVDVVKENSGTVIVQGTITKSNVAILTNKFFTDCYPIINIMDSNDDLHYIIDNNLMTIYEIMKIYEKTQPTGVHRYKGLGETSDSILEKAVMNPLDRILIQYTMDNIKEAVETIRTYESDKKRILSLVDNVTRDDLVE